MLQIEALIKQDEENERQEAEAEANELGTKRA